MFTKKLYKRTKTKDGHAVKIERKRTPRLLFKHRYYIYIYSKESLNVVIYGWEAVDIAKIEKELKGWEAKDFFKKNRYLLEEFRPLFGQEG